MAIFYRLVIGDDYQYWSDYDDVYHYLLEQGWSRAIGTDLYTDAKSELWTKAEYNIELDRSYIARAYVVKEVLQ